MSVVKPLKGAYQLLLRLDRPAKIRLGRREFELPSGWYVYTGSALRGLESRLRRHLRRRKRVRWHIDRLLRYAKVEEVFVYPSEGRNECEVNLKTLALPRAEVPVPRFGSSDCRRCPAHLVRFPERPQLPLKGGLALDISKWLKRRRRRSKAR